MPSESALPDMTSCENKFNSLRKVNNEAKVRGSTKLLVLGTARVMSYEDLEEIRAKRAARDSARTEGQGKRGRKCKKSRA